MTEVVLLERRAVSLLGKAVRRLEEMRVLKEDQVLQTELHDAIELVAVELLVVFSKSDYNVDGDILNDKFSANQ